MNEYFLCDLKFNNSLNNLAILLVLLARFIEVKQVCMLDINLK
jgi:hypothetical protein